MNINNEISKEELEVLQILIVHHKYIQYSDASFKGWVMHMSMKAGDVYISMYHVNHAIVSSLLKKDLLKRELNNVGKAIYVLNETNEQYADLLKELRVRKALGVEINTADIKKEKSK